MNSIKIHTNWSTAKPLDACVFARYMNELGDNGCKQDDSEDIENLLESFENCVNLIQSSEETTDCQLVIKAAEESDANFETRIDSFSMLCSAKVVEIHGNESNEYLKTIFNEFVDQLDELSMYRSDCRLDTPQNQLTITFKNFAELWIYAIVIKLIRKPIKSQAIDPKGVPNLGSLLSIMSMMNMSSRVNSLSLSDNQNQNLAHFANNKPNDNQLKVTPNESHNCDTTSNSAKDGPKADVESSESATNQMCHCLCHKNNTSEHLHQYIDQKFSDLEKSIDNKFVSLENKMLSFVNLFINKQ